MTYYRVIVEDKVYRRTPHWQETIHNQLFTPGEYKKYSMPDKNGDYIKPTWVETVNVSPKNTYWFFGARFEIGRGWRE